jgi:predicted amidohydrolase
MNRITVAAVQAKPRSATFDELLAGGDVPHALELLERAASLGADLACFPELYPAAGEEELAAAARAAGIHVIAGIVEHSGEATYNTATLLGPDGALVGRQRKVFPTEVELGRGIVAGDCYDVYETPLGRIGMIVCADLPFSRRGIVDLVRRGADVVFNPAWWFALGEAYPATIIARHLEYGVPIVGVDIARCALAVEDEDGGTRTLFPEAGGYTTAAVTPPCRTLDELGDWYRTKAHGTNSMADFVTSLGEDEDVLVVEVDVDAVRAFPGYWFSESAPKLAAAELSEASA